MVDEWGAGGEVREVWGAGSAWGLAAGLSWLEGWRRAEAAAAVRGGQLPAAVSTRQRWASAALSGARGLVRCSSNSSRSGPTWRAYLQGSWPSVGLLPYRRPRSGPLGTRRARGDSCTGWGGGQTCSSGGGGSRRGSNVRQLGAGCAEWRLKIRCRGAPEPARRCAERRGVRSTGRPPG